jgi:hypothetical protein
VIQRPVFQVAGQELAPVEYYLPTEFGSFLPFLHLDMSDPYFKNNNNIKNGLASRRTLRGRDLSELSAV